MTGTMRLRLSGICRPDSPPPCGEGLGVGGWCNLAEVVTRDEHSMFRHRILAAPSPPPQPSPTRGEGVSSSLCWISVDYCCVDAGASP